MTKDYYRILGVLDDAEDIVIRAAYKVLAQKYHPDKWKGDKAEATRRMSEINEAYGVLSDVEKRKQYDETRDLSKFEDDSSTERVAKESSDFLDNINRDWSIAKNHYPEIDKNHQELEKFSYVLGFCYKLFLLETQFFQENNSIFIKFKEKFLQTCFGNDPKVINFAEELIKENKKNAAIELNENVRVLGSALIAEKVISDISRKYQTNRYLKNQKIEHQNKIRDIENEKSLSQLIYTTLLLAIIYGVYFYGGEIFAIKVSLILGILYAGYLYSKKSKNSVLEKKLIYPLIVISIVLIILESYLGIFNTFIVLILLLGFLGGYVYFKDVRINFFKHTNKKIVLCPNCKTKLRVPSSKHIRISCKNCLFEWTAFT